MADTPSEVVGGGTNANSDASILPHTAAECDCCPVGENGVVYCFDGRRHVLPFPTDGGPWILRYVPGVGLQFVNEASIGGPIDPMKVKPPKKPPGKGKRK